MSEYIAVFKAEARKRFDAGMSVGKAAADIKLGRFDAWIGAQDRLVMNTVRFYHEFDGTLKPEMDAEGLRVAAIEFNAVRGNQELRRAPGSSVRLLPHIGRQRHRFEGEPAPLPHFHGLALNAKPIAKPRIAPRACKRLWRPF